MNPLRTLGLFGAALLAPELALASHGGASYGPANGARVEIANFFDGEVEVYLDGRYSGLVAGDGRILLETRPGPLDVRVQRPGTGFVLVSTRLFAERDARLYVPVQAPMGIVRLRNSGDWALRVDVDGQDAWLAPRSEIQLRVASGNVDLAASLVEARGDAFSMTRDLWVEPGQVQTTVLSPDPSVVRVYNRENTAVRVMLDGVDAGTLAPGATREMLVRSGTTRIVLVDMRGTVRYSNVLDVPKGATVLVDARDDRFRGPVPVHGPVAVNDRPSRY